MRKGDVGMSLGTTAACRFRQIFLSRGKKRRMARQIEEDGPGAVFAVGQLVRDNKLEKPLVVIGANAERMAERVLLALEENDIAFSRYAGTTALLDDGEAIYMQWLREGCGCFIALGDTPVIDIVKAAAARAVCRGKTILELTGVDRIPHRHTAPVIAIPTSAGDGAEIRGAAAIRDGMGAVYHMESAALIPEYSILDPELLEDAPRSEIAAAAMDGICLAVEAYLSGFADETSKKASAEAVKGFFASIEPCWNDGGTPAQRNTLLTAGHRAAEAASVGGGGYIRSLCRACERIYDVRAGEIAAVLLPITLEKYGNRAYDGLSSLSSEAGLPAAGSPKATSAALIQKIRDTAFRIGLPDSLDFLRAEDVAELADTAAADANSRFYSPVIWDSEECTEVLRAASARLDL